MCYTGGNLKRYGCENVIKTNELKGIIVKNGLTQSDVANLIGITPKTFYEKMKIGVFGSDEIQIMIDKLHIDDPVSIFFCQRVTLKDTKGGSMNELIKINYETEQPTVSARDLHEQLNIGTAFKDWFPRMCEYGFEKEKDFNMLKNERVEV